MDMSLVTGRLKYLWSCMLLGFTASSFALPEECIEDPLRRGACPHIIYKTVMLPNKASGEEEKQLVCICLSDFRDLFTEADTEVQQKIKEMNLRSLSAQLGISEEIGRAHV